LQEQGKEWVHETPEAIQELAEDQDVNLSWQLQNIGEQADEEDSHLIEWSLSFVRCWRKPVGIDLKTKKPLPIS